MKGLELAIYESGFKALGIRLSVPVLGKAAWMVGRLRPKSRSKLYKRAADVLARGWSDFCYD